MTHMTDMTDMTHKTYMTIGALMALLISMKYKINKTIQHLVCKPDEDLHYYNREEMTNLFVKTDDELLATPYKKASVNWDDRTESDRYYLGPHLYDDFLKSVKDSIVLYRQNNAWDIPKDVNYKACGFISLSDIEYNWNYYNGSFQDGGGLDVWEWMDLKREEHSKWQKRQRQQLAIQKENERRQIVALEKQQQKERAQEMDKWQSDRMEVRGRPSRKVSWFWRLLKGK